MPKVFISYRRDDTLAFTGRLRDKLAERFGPDQVFMDFDNIPLGSDFREHLQGSLKECDVLLAVIGPNWTGTVADANRSRLSDPADFVRLEIQVALERDIPIIPVLVGDASMPTEEELPPDLEPLLYRQAAPVDMARDFHVHADRLVNGIEQITEPRRTRFEERDSTVKGIQLLKSLRGALLIDDGSTAIGPDPVRWTFLHFRTNRYLPCQEHVHHTHRSSETRSSNWPETVERPRIWPTSLNQRRQRSGIGSSRPIETREKVPRGCLPTNGKSFASCARRCVS